MVAELISVGTEILLGNIVNTNVTYLARKCASLGISVYHQVTVGDNENRLTEALQVALSRSDIIIMTGGLGPTQDDITKETVAKVIEASLITDVKTQNRIKSYFEHKGIEKMPANNMKQAEIIEGSIVIDNDWGTAPGQIAVTKEGKHVILLPGPESEMIPMFERSVEPYLKKNSGSAIVSRIVKICGIAESQVETMILDLVQSQKNSTLATYAKQGEVHIRVTASADNEETANQLVKPMVKELKQRFKEAVFSTEEDKALEDVVVELLAKHELTVVTAESCTGGMVAQRIVNVSGASDVFKEGFITYSNKAKKKYLDVKKATLKKYTAVSEKIAKEMAKGAAITTDSDTSISVTGLAGPGGGTDEIPVGTVYIGCYAKEKTVVKKYHFKGSRNQIRERATVAALDLLRRTVMEYYE